jgi:hypothetical protein
VTLLNNCIAYLTDLRDGGDDDVLVHMTDGAIQREAARMANVLIEARAAFMNFDLDTDPEN